MFEIAFFIIALVLIPLSFFIYKKPELGLFLIVFSLPFERIPSYDIPFEWGVTLRISQILILLTFVVLVIKNVKKEFSFKIDKTSIFFSGTILLMGLSLFVAQDIKRGIMVWIFLWFSLLVFLVVKNLIKNKELFKKIEKYLFYSVLFICFFALYQFFGDILGLSTNLTGLKQIYTKEVFGFPRVQSTALEPLYLANFLLIPLGLFFTLYTRKQSSLEDKNILYILFFMSLVLVLTISRGGIVASLFMLSLILVFNLLHKQKLKRTLKGVFVLALGVVAAVSLIGSVSLLEKQDFTVNTETLSKQVTNFEQGASVNERTQWRNKAIEGFKEYPIFGIGLGNFGYWSLNYPEEIPEGGWPVVNNETLEILVETGLVGFTAFFVALIYFLSRTRIAYIKTKDLYIRDLIIAFFAILCAFAVQYQSFSTLYITHIWLTIGLLAGVQGLVLNEKGKHE